MTRRTIAAAAVAATLALPAAAAAHVTLQPPQAPAGGFARLDVRVPNEEDAKTTTKVVVQMPPGFADASYEPVAGWTVKDAKRKLATPIKTDDGDMLTEELATLTFTARPARASSPASSRTSACRSACPTSRPARSSRSRRCRPTPAARSCAGSARRAPSGRRRS